MTLESTRFKLAPAGACVVSSVMSDAIFCDVCVTRRGRGDDFIRERRKMFMYMYMYMSELMKKCFIDREVCEEEE